MTTPLTQTKDNCKHEYEDYHGVQTCKHCWLMRSTIESLDVPQTKEWDWDQIYNLIGDYEDGKKGSVEAIIAFIKKVEAQTRQQTLEDLKTKYERTQKELDEEYGEGVHVPHYMGILEAEIEELRQAINSLKTT